MNIATMPFINVSPYFHFLSARWLDQHRVVSAVPRQLGDLARLGKVDAGAFSYVDGLGLVESGEFEWLGSMGIAGQGPIQSILLCGAEGSSKLRGQAIAVSPQTATTVRLMEVWLRQKEGVSDYRLTGPDDNAAARLLIGDDALRRKLALGSSEVQIDLCEAWSAWTGLPFVFARWAVRKSLPDREKNELALTAALSPGLGAGRPGPCGR